MQNESLRAQLHKMIDETAPKSHFEALEKEMLFVKLELLQCQQIRENLIAESEKRRKLESELLFKNVELENAFQEASVSIPTQAVPNKQLVIGQQVFDELLYLRKRILHLGSDADAAGLKKAFANLESAILEASETQDVNTGEVVKALQQKMKRFESDALKAESELFEATMKLAEAELAALSFKPVKTDQKTSEHVSPAAVVNKETKPFVGDASTKSQLRTANMVSDKLRKVIAIFLKQNMAIKVAINQLGRVLDVHPKAESSKVVIVPEEWKSDSKEQLYLYQIDPNYLQVLVSAAIKLQKAKGSPADSSELERRFKSFYMKTQAAHDAYLQDTAIMGTEIQALKAEKTVLATAEMGLKVKVEQLAKDLQSTEVSFARLSEANVFLRSNYENTLDLLDVANKKYIY
jgi:hypothetical protein